MTIRIAIGVGHANSSGGNAYELGKNRDVVREVLARARDAGMDIRCWTPDDGEGMYPGPLDAAAGQVRGWVADGWKPHIVHEVHHEGTGTPSIHGGFVIYPDSWGLSGRKAGGDYTDVDVRTYGPGMADRICDAIGTTPRGNGTMSEASTNVGSRGYRLGFFGAVSDPYFRDHACVMITEAATYTNPHERALMDMPGFASREASGIIAAYRYLMASVSWFGGDASPPEPETPEPVFHAFTKPVRTVIRADVGAGRATIRRWSGTGSDILGTLPAGASVRLSGLYHGESVAGDDRWYVMADAPYGRIHASGLAEIPDADTT